MDASDPITHQKALVPRGPSTYGSRLALASLAWPGRHRKKGPGRNRGLIDADEKARGLLVGALLERGAQDVAQCRARIGGAILRDGFLLFGDFQRLDRDLHLAGLLVELDHPRVDLFADGKTLGALVVAIAGEF